jgi:hypothetical protein
MNRQPPRSQTLPIAPPVSLGWQLRGLATAASLLLVAFVFIRPVVLAAVHPTLTIP